MASTAAGKQRIPKVAKVGGGESGGDPRDPSIPIRLGPSRPGGSRRAPTPPAPGTALREAPEEIDRAGTALGNVS